MQLYQIQSLLSLNVLAVTCEIIYCNLFMMCTQGP